MKVRPWKKTGLIPLVGFALAIGIGTLASQSLLRAQGAPADSLQGTWLETVTIPGELPILTLLTCTGSGEVLADNNSPMIRSLGHGEWVKTGDLQFTQTYILFRFDGATTRKYIGTASATEKIHLESPDTFRAVGTFQRLGVNGKLESSTSATFVGKRISVASPLP